MAEAKILTRVQIGAMKCAAVVDTIYPGGLNCARYRFLNKLAEVKREMQRGEGKPVPEICAICPAYLGVANQSTPSAQ